MKAAEIPAHFLSRADWVDPSKTVDRVIVGDPGKEVRTALVTWISSLAAVREAVRRGVDALITHEPTFYTHWDNPFEGSEQMAAEKRAFIEEYGLVIIRLHDTWDRWPEVGIPWAWGRFLALGDRPVALNARRDQIRYDVPPVRFLDLAKQIAARTATIGEPTVQYVGDPDRIVSKVGIGTGCICRVPEFMKMGCDVSVITDDGTSYWGNVQHAADVGHPVIRVNHGTSEEPGMVTLTQYVNANLPPIAATHLPHGCCFRLAGAPNR